MTEDTLDRKGKPTMRNRLDRITLRGFKTIRELEGFEPGNLTVLIGPNGVGKSNFISFFRMMSWALADPDNLPFYVGQQGGASVLLHDGPNVTLQVEAELTLTTDRGENQYSLRLFHAAGDIFIFADEKYRFSDPIYGRLADWVETGGVGHRSPKLIDKALDDTTASVILTILRRINVYQFHNTSETARIRTKWYMDDNRYLKEDAANLAPVLFRLKEYESRAYQRIVDTIRLILPFFSDFELEPEHGSLLLRWRERNSDQVFSVSQASDGMLRVIALITMLLQPKQNLPDVLILDEPELGLHPSAINIVGGLINSVSTQTQIVIATQSTRLLDCFDPQDVVVVERAGRASTFNRLDPDALDAWLEEYSMSELWEKNIFGGRP